MASAASETVIHPTAVVLPGAELGDGVEIGPYCIIEPGVVVGDGCKLIAHVHLRGRLELGPGCTVGTGTVLGGEPQDVKFDGSRGLVRIGANCRFFEHCTVHRPTTGDAETVLEDNIMMMAGAHIGHNAHIGSHALFINHAAVGGHGIVGERAIVAKSSAVHQFGRVGRLTLVAGCTLVTRDAPPFSIVTGSYPIVWRSLNTVGLRRAGMDSDTRSALRKAMHRMLASSESPTAVAKELQDDATPEVAEAARFVLESRRGIAVAARNDSAHD